MKKLLIKNIYTLIVIFSTIPFFEVFGQNDTNIIELESLINKYSSSLELHSRVNSNYYNDTQIKNVEISKFDDIVTLKFNTDDKYNKNNNYKYIFKLSNKDTKYKSYDNTISIESVSGIELTYYNEKNEYLNAFVDNFYILTNSNALTNSLFKLFKGLTPIQITSNNTKAKISSKLSLKNTYKIYYLKGSTNLKVKYPSSWLIEYPGNGVNVAFLQPENGNNFRSNFNVITSMNNHTLPDISNSLVEMSTKMKSVFPDYHVLKKEIKTLNSKKYLQVDASLTMYGYPVKQRAYIIKPSAGKAITITFTISRNKFESETSIMQNVISTLIIL